MDIDPDRERREGGVVVKAVIGSGPNAGQTVLAVHRRDWFQGEVLRIRDADRAERRRAAKRLRRVLSAAVGKPPGSFSPANDRDLIDGIATAMAFSMVEGQASLEGTGLAIVGIEIDPDESLPWHRRGMLEPGFLDALPLAAPPRPQ
jgi:hypothetical protein